MSDTPEKPKRIGLLTSGGDAPGMNAAIRSVVRCGSFCGVKTLGIRNGFQGLIEGEIEPLSKRSVGGIMLKGGTMLGSARAPEFMTPEGRQQAIDNLQDAGIDGMVIIGGNGSQAGSLSLHRAGIPTVGVASTIDNDLAGVDMSIGVDTALNTALQLVDRLRDTATSHHRAFVVEVMGRNCGYLAAMTGIASGAEITCTPEQPVSLHQLADCLDEAHQIGKTHFLVVVAEGSPTSAETIHEFLERDGRFDARLSVLGHVQRGGPPLAFDRLLASRTGARATEALISGESGVMAGLASGQIELIPMEQAILPATKVTPEILRLGEILSH